MQYLVKGIFSKHYEFTVDAKTPIKAIQKVLEQNNLKGKIERTTDIGNCVVTSLGKRKVQTNFKVSECVSTLEDKNTWCYIAWHNYDGSEPYWKHFLYKGSVQKLISEVIALGYVAKAERGTYWGKDCRVVKVREVHGCTLTFNVFEIKSALPQIIYPLYVERVLREVSKGIGYDVPNESIKYFFALYKTEQDREKVKKEYVATYKKDICKYLGYERFTNKNIDFNFNYEQIEPKYRTESGTMQKIEEGCPRLGRYNVYLGKVPKYYSVSYIVGNCIDYQNGV